MVVFREWMILNQSSSVQYNYNENSPHDLNSKQHQDQTDSLE